MAKKERAVKHRPTEAEIANDPSLRWFPYRRLEVIYSEVHKTELRFVRYEGGKIRLATLNGMGEIPGSEGLVNALSIRRLTAR